MNLRVWLIVAQVARLEAKCSRLEARITALSDQVLDCKAKEIQANDASAKLKRELDTLKLKTKAWLEQMEEEKAGVLPPGSSSWDVLRCGTADTNASFISSE